MNTTLYGVTPAHLAALQAIAERLGYTAQQGPTKGTGSASGLVRAVADGELIVLKRDAALSRQEVSA